MHFWKKNSPKNVFPVSRNFVFYTSVLRFYKEIAIFLIRLVNLLFQIMIFEKENSPVYFVSGYCNFGLFLSFFFAFYVRGVIFLTFSVPFSVIQTFMQICHKFVHVFFIAVDFWVKSCNKLSELPLRIDVWMHIAGYFLPNMDKFWYITNKQTWTSFSSSHNLQGLWL